MLKRKNVKGIFSSGGGRDFAIVLYELASILPRAMLTSTKLNKRQNGRRIKEEDEEMFTLTATDIHGILHKPRIRRLTPLEAFRLQGVPDEYFYRVADICSDTQLSESIQEVIKLRV